MPRTRHQRLSHRDTESPPSFRRVNVGCGPAEERVLLTGLHAVADIYCECCKTTLGWKYVSRRLIAPLLEELSFGLIAKVNAATRRLAGRETR